MKKYSSLNGFRAFLCIGIILMHIRSNLSYNIPGFIYNNIIPYFTNFVFLFMMVSAFSMCCGYYNKFKNKEIDLNEFYKRRYKRILPFFAIIVVIEVLYTHSITSVLEGFASLTMLFGFLPNIFFDTAGIGWFLGIIFVFYIIFPFFVFLLDNKERAWLSFAISILLSFECIGYFYTNKYVVGDFVFIRSFLFNLVFFVTGGIIFLYKDFIEQKIKNKRIIILLITAVAYVIFFCINVNEYVSLLESIILHALLLIFVLCYDGKILDNVVVNFLGNLSLEIYLVHMIVFRFIENVNIAYITPNDICNYLITSIFVILVSTLVTCVIKYSFKYIFKTFSKKNKLLDEAK